MRAPIKPDAKYVKFPATNTYHAGSVTTAGTELTVKFQHTTLKTRSVSDENKNNVEISVSTLDIMCGKRLY